MPDIPSPAATAARLQAILAERKALHAAEFSLLSKYQRAYAHVGLAVPLTTGKPRGRKPKAAAPPPPPPEPVPLLDAIDEAELDEAEAVGDGYPEPAKPTRPRRVHPKGTIQ